MEKMSYAEYVAKFGTEELERMDVHGADDVDYILCFEQGTILMVYKEV